MIEHFGQLKEFRISLKCICFNFVTKVIRKKWKQLNRFGNGEKIL